MGQKSRGSTTKKTLESTAGDGVPSGASLLRLKALDACPGLQSQLDEARHLCNHSARAEMVLKWLLEKFKKSTEARQTTESWTLLTTASRLIVPEKLAAQLGSSDILRIVQITLTVSSSDVRQDLISSIAAFCACLQQIAEAPNGAPVQALLRDSAEKAASFLGSWLQIADGQLESGKVPLDPSRSFIVRQGVLSPAFAIWDLREPTPAEHAHFSQDCLIPAASLVRKLANFTERTSTKRKRDAEGSISVSGYKQHLESLLARHVFLPARAALSGTPSTGHSSSNANADSSSLDELLKPLRALETKVALGPTLMNVALRCLPVMALRQRLRERTWVEAVFHALSQAEFQAADKSAVLTKMLSIVREHRFILSKDMLTSILSEHGHLGADPSCGPALDFALVAQVVKLDPEVFVDQTTSKRLFPGISHVARYPHASSATDEADSKPWLQDVIVPILQTFAGQREFHRFLQLWREELLGDDARQESIWSQFQDAVARAIEASLTHEQVRSLLKEHAQIVRDSKSLEELHSSIVILDAIVGGLHSNDLIRSLLPELKNILTQLLGLFDSQDLGNDVLARSPCIWALCNKLFKTWFPYWAAEQTDKSLVFDSLNLLFGGKKYLSTKSMKALRSIAAADALAGVVVDAQQFLAAVILASYEYGDDSLQKSCRDCLRTIPPTSPVFFQENTLLQYIKSETRDHFGGASLEKDTSECTPASVRTLEALLSDIARACPKTKTSIFATAAQALTSGSTRTKRTVLAALQAVPLAQMPVAVRRDLVDTVLRSDLLHGQIEEPTYAQSLSFVARMVTSAHIGAEIDSSTVCFLTFVDPSFRPSDGTDETYVPTQRHLDSHTIALYQQLVHAVIAQWLSTQDRNDSADRLKEVSQTVMRLCRSLSKHDGYLGRVPLMLANQTMIQDLTKADFKSPEISSQTIKLHTDMLFQLADDLLASDDLLQDERSLRAVSSVLDCLLQLPEGLLTKSGTSTQNFRAVLGKLVARLVARLRDSSNQDSAGISCICFQLACRWKLEIPDHTIVSFGIELLKLKPKPDMLERALKSFQTTIQDQTEPSTQMQIMHDILARGEDEHLEALMLLQIAITASTKTENEGIVDTNHSVHQVYHQVLQIAAKSGSVAVRRAASSCIATILREKPFMVNQYAIEETIATLRDSATDDAGESVIYTDVCRITTILLQQHRSRLQDRMHLVVSLLQTLVSKLFQHPQPPIPGRVPRRPLLPRHARLLSRVLQLLCNPPIHRKQHSASDLVDRGRKAQAHVGRYMPYVLHSYCVEILSAKLAEDVREALLPGLWAVIEAMEVGSDEAVPILSAAMNNSERAVLRSLYDNYKTFRTSTAL